MAICLPVPTSLPVAPCAGAWIEMRSVMPCAMYALSPPARGRGLKSSGRAHASPVPRRPLRGGVD